MGLTAFATFQSLMKKGHYSLKMGFHSKPGEINILNSRMRVARSFRGINLDGFSTDTKLGYDAFLQVFLTHAALERYMCCIGVVNKQKKPIVYGDRVIELMKPHHPERVIEEFIKTDSGDRFFSFVHARLDSPLQVVFEKCKDGTCYDVGAVSAAIRHIFAHGHLTAHANRLNVKRVHRICMTVSDFVLDFVDADFTRRINEYCEAVGYNANTPYAAGVALPDV